MPSFVKKRLRIWARIPRILPLLFPTLKDYPLSVGIACLKCRNIEISSRSVPDAYRNLLVQPRNPECIFFYYAQYEYVSAVSDLVRVRVRYMHLLYVRYGRLNSIMVRYSTGCSELTVTLRVISANLTASQQMDDWAGYRPYYYEKLRCGTVQYNLAVLYGSGVSRVYMSGERPVCPQTSTKICHCGLEGRTCVLRW